MRPPLYVEANALLVSRLTGIGRFIAHLVEALARSGDLRLVSMTPRNEVLANRLRSGLSLGEEIVIEQGALAGVEGELDAWVTQLLRLPARRHGADEASRGCGVYTQARPEARHFGRELSVLYAARDMLASSGFERLDLRQRCSWDRLAQTVIHLANG